MKSVHRAAHHLHHTFARFDNEHVEAVRWYPLATSRCPAFRRLMACQYTVTLARAAIRTSRDCNHSSGSEGRFGDENPNGLPAFLTYARSPARICQPETASN